MLQYDRQLTISTAGSRTAANWAASTVWWSELISRLQTPQRGAETMADYLALPKSQQDALKDCGGFVGGALLGGRRKASCVQGRDLLTLDLDSIPSGSADEVLRRLDGLGCGYAVYSTRKHRPDAPRLRVCVPTDRTASADEYEPLLRKLAALGGLLPWCDPSTFEAARLMYWPSVCADAEYICHYADRPFLAADGVLALYSDWRDVSSWPQVPGATKTVRRAAARQEDPTTKSGVAGAFCRTYNIYGAMETYLPGVYLPTNTPGRYTYAGGSTTGGAVVYDDGQYLYSHHATDPCSGKLVNAFDLVRLHRFGDLDDDAKPGTPVGRLPSYTEMQSLAVGDSAVAALLNSERYQTAVAAFGGDGGDGAVRTTTGQSDDSWMQKLELHKKTGLPDRTINNVKTIVQYDPLLRGRVRLDLFSDSYVAQGPLPWELRRDETGLFRWTDRDDRGLRNYLEMVYQLKGRELVEDGLGEAAASLAFDPVREYLASCRWDGDKRLDRLYIDYLGADDSPYTRAVTRKAFVAAVARAMEPGTKFDNMVVVCGRQGIGKSTLHAKMGRGWFSDSLKTFDGKEAAELIQGVWICEISELEAMSRTDIRVIKSFLSKLDDQYRAAYARKTEKHPRRCVFFGTTNDRDYLKDPTGNRRFWPIETDRQPPSKSVFRDLDESVVAQLWAEATYYWRVGEPLYLASDLEAEADLRRGEHFDVDPLRGQIEMFLAQPVPSDWQSWSVTRRRMYWSGALTTGGELVPRDRVCALEIVRECIGDTRAVIPRQDSNRITAILQSLPGWERVSAARFGDYGIQRGFRRVN